MTEAQALAAARLLRESGHPEAAEAMEVASETARKQHFQDMARRCYDDPDFADAYEADARERW